MKISVVVPVHNGGDDLRACLQAIQRSERQPDEVMVVDDGSSDGASACAKEFSARLLRWDGPARGAACARNRGAEKATGDLLVFVDADVEVHPDTLGRFETLFSGSEDVAAAFGSYDDHPSGPGRVSRYKNLLHHYVHQHGAREAETFWTGCGAVRRKVFRDMGGFAEDWKTMEDVEFGARLRGADHRILLCPEIQCTHRKRWTFRSLLRTDILGRALPWSRLIVRQGQLPAGLNTDNKSRLSAAFAWLTLLLLGVGLGAIATKSWTSAACGLLALMSGGAVCAMNVALYRFFFAHGGFLFGLSSAMLHFLYLLYSSAVFGVVLAAHKICGPDSAGQGDDDARPDPSSSPLGSPNRIRWWTLALAFVLMAVYVGDGTPLPGNDATPNVHLAAKVVRAGKFTFTPIEDPSLFRWSLYGPNQKRIVHFGSWDERSEGRTMRSYYQQGLLREPAPSYYLSRTKDPNVFVSSYGFLTGFFAVPVMAAVRPFVHGFGESLDLIWLLAKIAASLAVVGSACFLFCIAAESMRPSSAFALALIYGLGTNVWSQSSQTLWQHGPGEFFLALGIFCLFRRKRGYAPYLAGFAYGLAFLCRPTNGVAVLVGLVFFLVVGRRLALRYLLGGLPTAIAFVAYNLHFFGKPIAFGQVTALAERLSKHGPADLWRTSFLHGLAGVLVSPSRGLLVYSPIVLVSLWAAFRIWRERRWLPLRASLLSAVGLCLVAARWSGWWGGWCYGYRLVADSAIFFAFLAIPVVEEIRRRRVVLAMVGLLAIWSVGAQALGAFAYDVKGWNVRSGYVISSGAISPAPSYFVTLDEANAFCKPRGCAVKPVEMDVDHVRYRDRLWNVRDSEILYYLGHARQSRKLRWILLKQFLASDG